MIFPFLPFMCVWHLEIILWFSRSEISNFSISIFQCSHKLITIANYMLYYKHLIYIYFYYVYEASLVAQIVKNLLAIQKIQVPSLEQEDPLEKGMAIYYSVLAWRIKWTGRSPGGGSGNPPQYSCLEISLDSGVHVVYCFIN